MIGFSDAPTQNPLTITVKSLRAQHDGAEILVSVLLEDGEHREQKNQQYQLIIQEHYSVD